MKPRIFVSSTFYDLKYIREDLSNFIKTHDFEPIMFEEGDIGYTPGKALDESCYENMRSSDMVILIIGGNYGSPASGEKEDSFEEYLSVTRKEFETAIKSGIPVYVFVDSSVYSEYGVYEVNHKDIEEHKVDIGFRVTKNINVFRFIKVIKNVGNIPIIDFKRANEIKEFLSKQWADMFKNYLRILREEKNAEQINDAMESMRSLIEQMGVMVNGLGQKLINNDQNIDYDKLLKEQYRIKAKDIVKKICKYIKCEFDESKTRSENISNLIELLCKFINEKKGNDNPANTASQVVEFAKSASLLGIDLRLLQTAIRDDDLLKEMCKEDEVKKEVKRILSNDFYYKRIIGVMELDTEEQE